MMLMFDLPVKSSAQRRIYAGFRKSLIRRGYSFFQKSVYIKLLRNISSAEGERDWAKRHAPENGRVHMMDMNLNEFRSLTAIRGDAYDVRMFADDVVFVGVKDERELSDDALLQMESEMKAPVTCRKEAADDDDGEPGKPDWIETWQLPF